MLAARTFFDNDVFAQFRREYDISSRLVGDSMYSLLRGIGGATLFATYLSIDAITECTRHAGEG